jgi:pimeloyl-ACP methyl ester carboxylesterase
MDMTWKPGADEVARAVDDLRAMERHVTLSHGDTRYFECGTGPAVLLLHGVGYTAGGSNWLFNLRALSAGRRVIAPDFAGFGTGGRLAQPYSFAYLVDFVREFQDALGLPSSDVVGHSMGGWVASLLAYESPDRVGRLVLVASGGTATRPLASMTRFTPPARAAHDEAVAQRLALPAEAAAPLAELEWRAASVPGAAEAYQRLLDHMTDPETRQRYSTVRRLPLVTAPTLVLWGKDDTVNDPAMGTTTASLLPDARLTLLDCGHAVPTQAAPAFNEAVSGFLSPAPAGPR